MNHVSIFSSWNLFIDVRDLKYAARFEDHCNFTNSIIFQWIRTIFYYPPIEYYMEALARNTLSLNSVNCKNDNGPKKVCHRTKCARKVHNSFIRFIQISVIFFSKLFIKDKANLILTKNFVLTNFFPH